MELFEFPVLPGIRLFGFKWKKAAVFVAAQDLASLPQFIVECLAC